jgi:arylsulfatase A-like enzyme
VMRLGVILFLGLLMCSAVLAAEVRPNIIVIVVDDLGWAGVGYHNKAMMTPNLDKLAKESTELQRFYVYPVCSPTRAALLTGQVPRRFGITTALNGNDPGIPAGLSTIAGTLKSAGYRTSLVGKWHLGKATVPQGNGFEHFYGFLSASVDYYKHTAKNGQADWQRDGKAVEEEGYSTYLLADDVVRQVKSRDKTKPFYIQLCLNAPHDPLSAPEELVRKHKAKGEKLGLFAAVVEAMDVGIGRVLNVLESEKIKDNTLVVFFSDNGAAGREGGDNTPFNSGKGSVYEGGIHTPALVRWPGRMAAGAALAQPICVQDLYPTLVAAAGATMPAKVKVDGTNQLNAWLSGKVQPRDAFVVSVSDTALIDGDWKLIKFSDGKKALYNLKDDLSEKNNLVTKQADVVAKLSVKMDELTKGLPEVSASGAREGPRGQVGKGARGN